MARRGRGHRLGLALVLLLAALGLVGGIGGGVARDAPDGQQPSAIGLAPTAVDAAHLPIRTEAGVTTDPLRQGSGRGPVPLVAVLLGLAGAALGRGRVGVAGPATAGCPPLRARRHAIALRAPPRPRFA